MNKFPNRLPYIVLDIRLPGVSGLDKAFHLRLTDEALRNPIFQITDSGDNAAAWDALPTFSQYARVESLKPGATTWAVHEEDVGPQGKRILADARPQRSSPSLRM